MGRSTLVYTYVMVKLVMRWCYTDTRAGWGMCGEVKAAMKAGCDNVLRLWATGGGMEADNQDEHKKTTATGSKRHTFEC